MPATGEHPTLSDCLDALHRSSEPPTEVIVVSEPREVGPAQARNLGAAQATGEVLVFVDSDVRVHHDGVARIREAFAADPSLGALFGSYDDSPTAPGHVSQFRNLLHHHTHQAAAGEAETFWAGLGAVRRDVFEAAGGFDAERFPRASIEDIELGMRLARMGTRIRLDAEIQGTHLKRWTLLDMVEADFSRRGLPWVALLVRTGEIPSHLNLGWRQRASAIASLLALAGVARRRPAMVVAAMAALIALNRSLYALVARRCGPVTALAGVGVHVVHHGAAAAAVPAGLLAQALDDGAESSARQVVVDEAPAGVA